jgi:hypothetical protein
MIEWLIIMVQDRVQIHTVKKKKCLRDSPRGDSLVTKTSRIKLDYGTMMEPEKR